MIFSMTNTMLVIVVGEDASFRRSEKEGSSTEESQDR